MNSDVKMLAQIFAQLFSEFGRARGNQVNVLAHARLTHIGVNSLGSEHNGIVAAAQELEHRVVDCRQRQLFAHGKLLEGKSSGVEHESNNTPLFSVIQDSYSRRKRRGSPRRFSSAGIHAKT